jgi:hypothetical protein
MCLRRTVSSIFSWRQAHWLAPCPQPNRFLSGPCRAMRHANPTLLRNCPPHEMSYLTLILNAQLLLNVNDNVRK